MLDHDYRVKLRLCGGPLHGLEGVFRTNLTPGEIMRVVDDKLDAPVPYVLLEGPAIAFAISSGNPSLSLCGVALHVPVLPESRHGTLN